MPRSKHVLPADPKKIARLYVAGQSINQLAAQWKISAGAVYRILIELGVPRRPRGAPAGSVLEGKLGIRQREQMRADLRSGRFSSLTEIARKYGVTRECVRLYAAAAGVTNYTQKARREAGLERERRARAAREAARETQRKQLAALWRDGVGVREIARALGFKNKGRAAYQICIWRALYPADFPFRSKGIPEHVRREQQRVREALWKRKRAAKLAREARRKRERERARAVRRKAMEARQATLAELWRIGASFEEIANFFGIAVGSAKVAIRRCRGRSPADFPRRISVRSRGRRNSRE